MFELQRAFYIRLLHDMEIDSYLMWYVFIVLCDEICAFIAHFTVWYQKNTGIKHIFSGFNHHFVPQRFSHNKRAQSK